MVLFVFLNDKWKLNYDIFKSLVMRLLNILILSIIIFGACDSLNTSNKNQAQKEEDSDIKIRKKYDDDGKLITTVPYKGNIKHGIAKHYYPDGKVSMEIPYVNNKKHGESIYYYTSGKPFRITPYVNDKKHGIQKKYYEDGKLMAEIPYKNSEAIPGLKEYTQFGELLTQYPSVVFEEINKLAFENKIVLRIYLTDNSKNVDYYRKHIKDDGDTIRLPIEDKSGVVELDFYIPKGKMVTEKIEIIAIKTTRRKNPYVIEASYNLAAENRLL